MYCECGVRQIHESNSDAPSWSMYRPSPAYKWKSLLGYAGEPIGTKEGRALARRSFGKVKDGSDFGDDMNYNTFLEWVRIVEDYSARDLSFQSDKLVAVSGLAKIIGQVTELQRGATDQYCAGLWRSSLIPGLSWQVSKEGQAGRQESYRAPTWSWASIDGQVTFKLWDEVKPWKYRPTMVTTASVLRIRCEPVVESDPFGALRSASLELSGPLAPVEICTVNLQDQNGRSYGLKSWVRGQNLRSYPVVLDVPTGPKLGQDDPSFNCWDSRTCCCGSCHWENRESPLYYCLQLFVWECRSRSHDPRLYYDGIKPITWFLVVQRHTHESSFTRIGLAYGLARKDPEWPKIGDSRQTGKRFECHLFEHARESRICLF